MSIIGCDLHSRHQQIGMLEMETGEIVTRRLEHENGEAKAFYASLPKPPLIGIEATGYTQWFEQMLAEIGHEFWMGDPAEIWARSVRRQVTHTRAAEHLLDSRRQGSSMSDKESPASATRALSWRCRSSGTCRSWTSWTCPQLELHVLHMSTSRIETC